MDADDDVFDDVEAEEIDEATFSWLAKAEAADEVLKTARSIGSARRRDVLADIGQRCRLQLLPLDFSCYEVACDCLIREGQLFLRGECPFCGTAFCEEDAGACCTSMIAARALASAATPVQPNRKTEDPSCRQLLMF